MPQTCGVDSRAGSGAPGTAESGAARVIAMFGYSDLLLLAPRPACGIAIAYRWRCLLPPPCGEGRRAEASRGGGPLKFFLNLCNFLDDANAPTRPSLRDGHPPHAFRGGGIGGYPATSLMRAISSSTAFSTGTFSLRTRFVAFAQTFSLLRIVNFQFLVKSKGCVPPVNWL